MVCQTQLHQLTALISPYIWPKCSILCRRYSTLEQFLFFSEKGAKLRQEFLPQASNGNELPTLITFEIKVMLNYFIWSEVVNAGRFQLSILVYVFTNIDPNLALHAESPLQ